MNDENRDDREAERVHGDETGAGAEHTAPASAVPRPASRRSVTADRVARPDLP